MTVAELRTRRKQLLAEHASGRRHLLATIRRPPPEIAHLPIGDLLCACDGLDEASASRILAAAAIPWGRPVRLLTGEQQTMLCWQVKAQHPGVWERWRESVRGRR